MGGAQEVYQQDAIPRKSEVRKSQKELENSTVPAEMGFAAHAKCCLNRRLRTNRRKYSYRRGSKRLLGDVRRGQKCVWELDIQQLDGVLRIQNIPLVTEDHVLYDPRII